jgi:aryl-alcohol dehydrogenase-like predicted oxidoreductase
MNRLALGTVQFGQRYGVANVSGQPDVETAAAIIELAGQEGIDTLDTAAAYGSSETCLGEVGVSGWRVITKLPPLPDDVPSVSRWADAQLRGSLQRLRVARLEALLLHRPADLLGARGAQLVAALEKFKSGGWVHSLGISIYDPCELDAIWPVWRPEFLQAPCNVLDRRLVRSGWLAKLSEHGVRVHVRSLFLQGLLLMSAAQRPACFVRWQRLLNRWLSWCSEHGTTPLYAALAFGEALPGVERLVVGVDSIPQLRQILAAMNVAAPRPPDDLFSEDRDLLEPSRWQLS